MTVGVLKEQYPGETRVSLAPGHVQKLVNKGALVKVEKGAGELSGLSDNEYSEKGAEVVSRDDVIAGADVLLTVRFANADPENSEKILPKMKNGSAVIGMADPYQPNKVFEEMGKKEMTLFSMERIPRITRAQSMDALSSMANLAGYKAAILAADNLPKMFPMMMTAAGTIVPAKVFVLGVGVAGLQAIATAKRLGAVVKAYDIRPEVREQVESLGARFLEVHIENKDAEAEGGYAKEMGEEFYKKQRELMLDTIAESDAVITTAAVPGKKAPTLVTTEMVDAMKPGSVIIDLAAERGGNCELTQSGKNIKHGGVYIMGPENIPSTLAFNASQLYSRNISAFLLSFVEDGKLNIDSEDEVVTKTLVLKKGQPAAPEFKQLFPNSDKEEQ